MVRKSGHPDRHGHRAQLLILVANPEAHDLFTPFLGSLLANLQGCTRQNHEELLPPIAKSTVVCPAAKTCLEEGAELTQHRVSSRMPKVRVELPEVIDVNHDDPHRL